MIISVDAELGWGHHDHDAPPRHRIESARAGWTRLQDLLERFELPATWAVVGHLLLDECDGCHDGHPAPEGWFARERGSWRDRPELRYARGLIRAIREADVEHEIACHSFSHVEFGAPETDRELARAEVRASLEAARERDIRMRSFVFPRNRLGHRDVLADHGFICYRGPSPIEQLSSKLARPALRAIRGVGLADSLLLVEPTRDEFGLVNIPASLYLYSFEGRIRAVCAPVIGDPIVRQAKRGIDLAAARKGVFHMWLHPNNLHHEYTVERLRTILAYLRDRQAEAGVSVETMRSVASKAQTGSSELGNAVRRRVHR